ncbi:MAG TPA: GDSL-type esterase/lipase family protein [Candidatus Limnocylindria bacterium]|nr:GDSL-type esterase/lipase family protein [Candidatus Limnocylindria bacterium]
MRRIAGMLAGAAVACGIFFAAGEVLSRTFHLVDRLNRFPRRLFMPSDDARLPYVMRPGVETVVRGVPVRVNALGLRGPEIAPTPAPGVRRVLALGDSATFGQGLPVEQAFPAVLERELDARTGQQWEVVNAGVEGYNTAAELAWLERQGLALAPEIVVVGFNLNDFDHAPVLGRLGVLTSDRTQRMSPASPANWSEFYLVLRWLARSAMAWLRGEPGSVVLGRPPEGAFYQLDRYASALRKAYYREPTDERWQVLEESLSGLGAVTRARGIRLVIAIIPDGDQVGVAEPDLTPQRKLAALCARAGLECLDLHPAFAAHADRGPLFRDIMHPNAAGQELIARALADRLLTG